MNKYKLNKKVSVIVAVYNAEDYIEECLDSILAQTWLNIEIIIINDGSTDYTAQKIKKYENLENILFFNQPNLGQCAATNIGLKHSSGDYIMFLDGDDVMHLQKIEIQVKTLSKYDEKTVAISNWGRVDKKFKTKLGTNNIKLEMPQEVFAVSPKDWLYYLWKDGMMTNSGYLIPREVLNETDPYLEHLTTNNDFEYFTRIALNSKMIVYCPDAITYYRTINNTLSGRKDFKSQDSILTARILSCKYFIRDYPKDLLVEEACFYAIWNFIYTYRDYWVLTKKAIFFLNKTVLNINKGDLIQHSGIKVINNVIGLKTTFKLLFIYNYIQKWFKYK